jgi:predicted nucleotide-binding protein
VHGHDDGLKETVARFLSKLDLEPVILHEQPNRGRTIIEKFEEHTDVAFAVVLFTPDDMGYPAGKPDETKPRARQNVVLELGFFMAALGRDRLCVLYKGGVDVPSDYSGVLYEEVDSKGAWRFRLATEIKSAGVEVDLNKAA